MKTTQTQVLMRNELMPSVILCSYGRHYTTGDAGLEMHRESILKKIFLNKVRRIQVDSCYVCELTHKLNAGESIDSPNL